MPPRQLQQSSCRRLLAGQASDREHGLPLLRRSDPPHPLQHAHLLDARPVQVLAQARAAPQATVLHPALRLVDAAGTLLIANDDANGWGKEFLPQKSPLPRSTRSATDSEVYYVVPAEGIYYLEVSASGDASAGKYDLDTMVARPGLEAQAVGTRQILFLDFDGAAVAHFSDDPPNGPRMLSPLASFLPAGG